MFDLQPSSLYGQFAITSRVANLTRILRLYIVTTFAGIFRDIEKRMNQYNEHPRSEAKQDQPPDSPESPTESTYLKRRVTARNHLGEPIPYSEVPIFEEDRGESNSENTRMEYPLRKETPDVDFPLEDRKMSPALLILAIAFCFGLSTMNTLLLYYLS
jgi:hypothetical protein